MGRRRRWRTREKENPLNRPSDENGSVAANEEETAGQPESSPERSEEEISYLEQLQRLQAEFANYRKRTQRERTEWGMRARADLVAQLLPILDDLERARENVGSGPPAGAAEGLLLILNRLEDVLTAQGLQRQSVEPGTRFDPEEHEALMTGPSDTIAEGDVIEALSPGYLFQGALLRPARVRVSMGPEVGPA